MTTFYINVDDNYELDEKEKQAMDKIYHQTSDLLNDFKSFKSGESRYNEMLSSIVGTIDQMVIALDKIDEYSDHAYTTTPISPHE